MNLRKVSVEQALYGLAFLIAAGFRFYRLGVLPLTDAEASLALQALGLADGSQIFTGGQPGYLLLTALVFYLFGSSEMLARFWPALAGSLAVFAPYLFRRPLGKTAALALSFMLAFEPGLLAVSRQADGLSLAVSFSLLAAGFLYNGRAAGAGLFAGLALLGGPGLWGGLLAAALAASLASFGHGRYPSGGGVEAANLAFPPDVFDRRFWIRSSLWALCSVFFAGTMFGRVSAGLGGLTASLPAYLSGWGQMSGTPLWLLGTALLGYQLAALLPALAGIWHAWKEKSAIDLFLAVWLGISLALALAYPARQVADLAWMLLPLWALAARSVARWLTLRVIEEDRLLTVAQTTLILVLFVFMWINLVGLNRPLMGNVEVQLRWAGIAGALVMLLLVSLLIAWGWSYPIAVAGLVNGAGIALAVYTLSAGWSAAGLGRNPSAEMWPRSPAIQQADLLLGSVADLSEWNVNRQVGVDVLVAGVDSPALRWLLRGFRDVRFEPAVLPEEGPSLVIASEKDALSLTAEYSGQDFIWLQSPAWTLISAGEWVRWAAFRELPFEKASLILWARTDLFPGVEGASAR